MNFEAKVRVTIYGLVAVLTTITNKLQGLSMEDLNSMIWTDWTVLIIAPVLAALISIRAFLDQSLSRDYKNQNPINLRDLERVEK